MKVIHSSRAAPLSTVNLPRKPAAGLASAIKAKRRPRKISTGGRSRNHRDYLLVAGVVAAGAVAGAVSAFEVAGAAAGAGGRASGAPPFWTSCSTAFLNFVSVGL